MPREISHPIECGAVPLSETTNFCTRCRQPINVEPVIISVSGREPPSLPTSLQICSACVESLSHWYSRGDSAHRFTNPNRESDGQKRRATVRAKLGSRKKSQNRPEKRDIRNLAIVFVFVVLTIAFTWLYLGRIVQGGGEL